MTVRTLVVVLAALAFSCSEKGGTKRTADEHTALGGQIAARVAGNPLPLSVIANVAEAQNVNLDDATRKVVDDEIAASAARARGLEKSSAVALRIESAKARFTSERLHAEAKDHGLPTDEEVKAVTERHWVEVDRPPSVRVVHALVMRPKKAERLSEARALASELERAVASASNADFESTAKTIPHDPKIQIIAEKLNAFTETGRVTEGGGSMDAVFAKAAFAIHAPGETSGIVETTFGFHVIRLLERIPERRMPLETRRLAFAEEVYVMRAHDLLKGVLDRQRQVNDVTIAPTAEHWMSTVQLPADTSRAP